MNEMNKRVNGHTGKLLGHWALSRLMVPNFLEVTILLRIGLVDENWVVSSEKCLIVWSSVRGLAEGPQSPLVVLGGSSLPVTGRGVGGN